MRKIYLGLFICILSLILINSFNNDVKLSADYNTGHNEYVSINFDNDARVLLVDLTNEEKTQSMKKVKWAFFGWQKYHNFVDVVGHYVGKTIFSRSNKTVEDIVFSYSSQLKETEESSITSEGTISGEVNAKGKTLSGGLEAKIRKTIGTVSTVQNTEKTSFKVTIKPGYKVSMIAKGNVRVNNGSAKYYFLGICFKKGHWEILDVLSEYYELVEEEL